MHINWMVVALIFILFAFPSEAEQIPATFLGWHAEWPGCADMYLTLAFCSSDGQILSVRGPNPNGRCGGEFKCNADYRRPPNTVNLNNDFYGLRFVTIIPQNSPPTSCPVGNSVDTSAGAKIRKESDIDSRGSGQIGFDRTYDNSNKTIGSFWYNPYQKSLRIIDPQKIEILRAKSFPYTGKAILAPVDLMT